MDLLRVWFSTRRAKAILALALVVSFALWSNTLTDHIGYGSALVAGLYGSITGALLGASGGRRLRALAAPYAQAEAVLGRFVQQLQPVLGAPEKVGEPSAGYLQAERMRTSRLSYRFSDYLATATASNLRAEGIAVREQYRSASVAAPTRMASR